MFEQRKSPWTTPQWLRPSNPPLDHQGRASSTTKLEPIAATQQQQQLVNLVRESTSEDAACALPAEAAAALQATLDAELATLDLESADEMLGVGMPPVQVFYTSTPLTLCSGATAAATPMMQISPGPRRKSLPAINTVNGKTWRSESGAVARRARRNSLICA